jgi:Leucine-rich repeat (LRR) protein
MSVGHRSIHLALLLLILILGATQLVSDLPVQARNESFSCASVTQIPQIECEGLVALYNATNGANWTNKSGWLATNTPCSWHGVSCSGGRVHGISLPFNNLNGVLPHQLENLAQVRSLVFMWNGLSGSIPPQLGNLAHLEALNLFENGLSGPIPPQLANLNNLRTLILSWNQLSGEIPIQLGNLANLRGLSLDSNQLSGTIPLQLSNLSNLEQLHLGYNQLSGIIPNQLGSLTNLRGLSLNDNQLNGTIPNELSNLHDLEQLSLGGNNLTGPIPTWLANLTELRGLDLGSNNLTGPIPPELGNSIQLQRLNLSRNQLSGEIPPQLGSMTELIDLWLSRNQLSGYLPSEFGNLSNLVQLGVSHNQLTGSIPLSFTNLTALVAFYFEQTGLCEPPDDSFQDWLSALYDVSSTNIVCIPLADDIEAYGAASREHLFQAAVQANQVSFVGDYFQDKLQADAIKLTVDTTLNLWSLFSVNWSQVGTGVKHIASPGASAVSHSWDGWVNDKLARHWYKPLYDRIQDHPQLLTMEWARSGIKYYAHEAGIEALEGPIKDWLIDEFSKDSNTTVRDLFGAPTLELGNYYRQELLEQELELLAILPSLDLSPAQQDAYRADMHARQEAQAQIVALMGHHRDLLWNSYTDAVIDENSWWNFWGRFLIKHAVIAGATLAWDGPGYYVATAGTAAVATIYDGVQGVRALAHDQKMIDQSMRFITNRTSQTYYQVSLNTVNGLYLIRNGTPPRTADGQLSNIEQHSIGQYRLWPSFWWAEESSRIALNLSNNAVFPTTFMTSALYTNTGFWVGAQQVLVDGEAKTVNGFSTNSATIPLKVGDSGLSPDKDSVVDLLVLGATSTGIYPVASSQFVWNPVRLDTRSGSVASPPAGYTSSEADNAPVLPYPVSSAVINLPDSPDYQVVVAVVNPFTLTVAATVTQTIPTQFTVIDNDGAMENGNALTWTTIISPGGSVELRPLITWEALPGSTIIMPPAELLFRDPITNLGDSYVTPEQTVHAPWPIQTAASFPFTWQSNITNTINVTLTNVSRETAATGIFTATLETIDGSELWVYAGPVNLVAGESQTISLPANTVYTGYAVLKGDLLLGDVRRSEFLEVILIKGNIYLPTISR